MTSQGSSSGTRCAESFDGAVLDTVKAWTSTSLLSMTKGHTVEQCKQVLDEKSASAISDLLVDMAGTAYAAYALKSGMDAERASKLSRIVVRLICVDLPSDATALETLATVHQRCKAWIDLGRLDNDETSDLKKIADLTGGAPEIRLALLAPYAPAIAACGVVMRADERRYPFASEKK